MSEIQRFPPMVDANPVHPNAKTTTQINNGTTCTKSNISSPVCRNCKTQTTPLWRRDETGQVLCNACGLFLKLHGRPRPISLKTDTIKLRNRIKQPNFSKLGPNTPELKLKDVKLGRKLPKSAKKKLGTSPLPDGSLQQTRSPLPSQPRAPFGPGAYAPLVSHFSGLPPQVQLLHYPLSTPTQFAPGLQRITSPLLLSTTALMLNARASGAPAMGLALPKGLSAVQAAGALENMLNELGPSATFKSGAPVNGGSLMGGLLKARATLSTPATALATPKLPALGPKADEVIASPSFGPQFHLQDHAVKHEAPDLSKPALPPLQHVQPAQAALPHFQSSFSSSALTPQGQSRAPSAPLTNSTSAPVASLAAASQPEKRAHAAQLVEGAYNGAVVAGDKGDATKPHATSHSPSRSRTPTNYSTTGNTHANPHNAGPSYRANVASSNNASASGSTSNANNAGASEANANSNASSNGNNGGGGNGNGKGGNNSGYEVTLLKTRISELELVNDLYRTRIMELEAMEQAARLREASMRKRLDEMLAMQGHDSAHLQRAYPGEESELKRFKLAK